MNKVVKWTIRVVIVLLVAYFGYQGYHFYMYNPTTSSPDYVDMKEQFKIGNSIIVKHKALSSKEYKNFQGIKMKNIVNGFDIKNQSSTNETYVLYNDKKQVEKSFSMTVGDSYIKKIETDQIGEDKSFKALNKKEILRKYNISNDIKLWEKIEEKKEDKVNIFTKVSDMKEQYFFQHLIVELPVIESITLIEGDLSGYIFNSSSNMREVHILKEGKRYSFLFNGDYQSQEIEEFLNTLII